MQGQPVGRDRKLHSKVDMYFLKGLEKNCQATKSIIVSSSKRPSLVARGSTPRPTSLSESRRSSCWKSLGRSAESDKVSHRTVSRRAADSSRTQLKWVMATQMELCVGHVDERRLSAHYIRCNAILCYDIHPASSTLRCIIIPRKRRRGSRIPARGRFINDPMSGAEGATVRWR